MLVQAGDITWVVTLAVHLVPAVWCAGTSRVHAIVLSTVCCTLVRDKVLGLVNTTIKPWSVLKSDKVVADGYRSQSFWFLWRSFLLKLYCCSHLSNHVVDLKNRNLELFVVLVSVEPKKICMYSQSLEELIQRFLQIHDGWYDMILSCTFVIITLVYTNFNFCQNDILFNHIPIQMKYNLIY